VQQAESFVGHRAACSPSRAGPVTGQVLADPAQDYKDAYFPAWLLPFTARYERINGQDPDIRRVCPFTACSPLSETPMTSAGRDTVQCTAKGAFAERFRIAAGREPRWSRDA